MSNYAIGSFAKGSPGNASVTGLSFLPSMVKFYIGARAGTTEVDNRFSIGSMDGNNQVAISTFRDATGARTKTYTNRCINHFQRDSGNIVEKLVATFVSFDNNGGGDFGFTVNFSAANSSYSILFEAFG